MFEYTFPCGVFQTVTTMTDTGISFDPPVYEQRYCAAIQILEDARWINEIKKVTEFGCSEMRFFQQMRRIETIEHILQVDIDDLKLKTYVNRVDPLISDYLRKRLRPLRVEILQGSVAESASQLQQTDAVVALELIEHVYDDVLTKIPYNIFGFIQPKIAIFTTPNSDYNVIFTRFNPLLPNGFRHFDHKFEWTRAEFHAWCMSITDKYPNYMFALMGVGDPPKGYDVGHVSQIALFVRKDLLGMPLVEPLLTKPPGAMVSYKSIHCVDFPFSLDTRTQEQKIWSEIECEFNRCTLNDDNYDEDNFVYKMSFNYLLNRVEHLGATSGILLQMLNEHNKQIEDGYIIIEDVEMQKTSSDEKLDNIEQNSTVWEEGEEELWDT